MERCWKNPDTRSCKTCVFFSEGVDGDVETPPADENCGAGHILTANDQGISPCGCAAARTGIHSHCRSWAPGALNA